MHKNRNEGINVLQLQTKRRYTDPVRDSLKSTLAWGWTLDQDQTRLTTNRDSVKRRASKVNIVSMKNKMFGLKTVKYLPF